MNVVDRMTTEVIAGSRATGVQKGPVGASGSVAGRVIRLVVESLRDQVSRRTPGS